MSLFPTLTTEDLRALRGLPASDRRGVRAVVIYTAVGSAWTRSVFWTLTGLEHLGLATCQNGWWKRAAAGDDYLAALDAPPVHQETLA